MFKKIFYNTGAQILAKAISASSTFIVTIIIGRVLGESGYGDFTKIFVFVGYFYTIADFGLNSIYIKHAQDKDENHLLQILFGLRFLIVLALTLTSILVAWIIPYNPDAGTGFSPLVKIGITIASLTILTQGAITSANAFFQRRLRYDFSAIATICGAITVLGGTVIASRLNSGLLGFSAIYVASGLSAALVSYLFVKKLSKRALRLKFDKTEFKKLLNGSWPVGIALVINLVYFRLDVLILTAYKSSAEVGIYGLAYQFFEAALTVPIFFSNAIYPVITSVFKKDFSLFKKQVNIWFIMLVSFAIALTGFLTVIAGLIPFIYNGQFEGSVQALRILALGMPFFFTSALLWHALIIFNKQKFLMLIYAAGAVLNTIANLMFIPKYSYIAASVITVVSEAFILVCLLVAYIYFANKISQENGKV